MTHLPADLAAMFPADTELLHRLKAADRHFQLLGQRYAAIDAEVQGIEAGTRPAVADEALETLKKQRLALLDAMASVLAGARAA